MSDETTSYARDATVYNAPLTKIDFDPFGVVELLGEKYGPALLADCHGYEVVGEHGEVTLLKVHLHVVRNPVKDNE